MRIVELADPVVMFLGDALETGDIETLIAAFETGPDGNPISNRAPGVHLSHIIHDLYARIADKHDVPMDAAALQPKNCKMAIGIAFEYILSAVIQKVFPRGQLISPGSFESDSVHMTPDRFDLQNDRVEEWKCTWFSAKKSQSPEELMANFWWYFLQIKSYCRVLGVRKALLRIWHINGFYPGGAPSPIPPKTWFMEFSQQDLDENWSMLLHHGKQIGLLK